MSNCKKCDNCSRASLPCAVGDKVKLKVCCECVLTYRDNETGAIECPFEDVCNHEECYPNNEIAIETTIDSILYTKNDCLLQLKNICFAPSISDLGKTVFLVEEHEKPADTARLNDAKDLGVREKPKYYLTARTVSGGKDLAYGIPNLESASVDSVITDNTVDDYVTEIILNLSNGEQCLLHIVQGKE